MVVEYTASPTRQHVTHVNKEYKWPWARSGLASDNWVLSFTMVETVERLPATPVLSANSTAVIHAFVNVGLAPSKYLWYRPSMDAERIVAIKFAKKVPHGIQPGEFVMILSLLALFRPESFQRNNDPTGDRTQSSIIPL